MAEDVHIIGDDFKDAFEALLTMIPKGKRAEAFASAAFCEMAFVEARTLLRAALPYVPWDAKDSRGYDMGAAIRSMIGEDK